MSDPSRATFDGLTRGEVAHRLHLSPERVAQLGRSGVLDYCQTPLGRLYTTESVEAYALAREQRRGGVSS